MVKQNGNISTDTICLSHGVLVDLVQVEGGALQQPRNLFEKRQR